MKTFKIIICESFCGRESRENRTQQQKWKNEEVSKLISKNAADYKTKKVLETRLTFVGMENNPQGCIDLLGQWLVAKI